MIRINKSLTKIFNIKLIYKGNLHFYIFAENRKINSKGNLYHSNFISIYYLSITYLLSNDNI